MEASDPLDGHNAAGKDGPSGKSNGLPSLFPPARQIDPGPAVIAADRLGVIAAGGRIVVFLPAPGAHGKYLHGGPVPVIGQGVQDGQPGAAAGAVDKGMEISGICGIIHLLSALVADGYVRGDEYLPFCLFALDDGKVRKGDRILYLPHIDLEDGGPSGRPVLQSLQEGGYPLRASLGKDLHIGPLVADAPPDESGCGMPCHGGSEAHPLNDAVDSYSFCYFG